MGLIGKGQRLRLGLVVCTLTVLAILLMLNLFGESHVLMSAAQVVLAVHEPPRTVVSITTFSERIFHMAPCLDSVFSQSQQPDRIIISIPKTYRKQEKTLCTISDCVSNTMDYDESPENVLKWFKTYFAASFNETKHDVFEFPKITVQFLEKDWGPATKVLGALLLEHDPDTVIITLDDDVYYNSDTVKWLSTHIDRQGMALSFGCEMWNSQHRNFVAFTTYSISNMFASTPRVCKGWLVGWTAVAHRVSNFGEDVWTYLNRLPRGCFYNDDIWISGYIARRGVLKVYAPWVLYHAYHQRDKELSLSTIEGTRERYALPCARELF
ncbi:hypothetical protein GUITHDRAFT_122554 [Guillardia theta CCMP2712]|uniref:Glycosyltransferase 2-like domain-containing protein n=1 Tax=Guillardia theta (strain CCMP2712) TaxID=905079 RepID=L1I586_GUITC|nr:hypothetical protein GUITHDRAFT_122554 [Guillardia theta CCMP2712]EKX31247.1 hypothetical protein GUITHDRAFT_122554 [Guillardia theta CCMP2712]|eukprot:XP_005818227.1 hypothetical protein GUITHDRAFT_122554 [Guillardia theta CCMP2712]